MTNFVELIYLLSAHSDSLGSEHEVEDVLRSFSHEALLVMDSAGTCQKLYLTPRRSYSRDYQLPKYLRPGGKTYSSGLSWA